MHDTTLSTVRELIGRLKACGGFYAHRFGLIDSSDIRTYEDFLRLPFTDKNDLRDAYPLGLSAVPEEEIVRIHSSSGTTGTPVIIPYTREDVEDWALLFKRCYEIAGVTSMDRIHVTPGYGLWTAGIGFQAGAELLGAMAIPMGPGNTEKQLAFMTDLGSTVLCATASHALLLAEEIGRRGCLNRIKLKKGIIGSERWGDKTYNRIKDVLGIQLYDIYGLTEVYGPGIAISCDADRGMHYFDDYLYFEIVDPKTLKPLQDGEQGELVITTLKKRGAPLIRYRTHDLTRIIPGRCDCGNSYPRIDRILGRTDDMIKVRGVNVYPGHVDGLLAEVADATGEYQVIIDSSAGKDVVRLRFESSLSEDGRTRLNSEVASRFRQRIGISVEAEAVPAGTLPRSEKKTKRFFDNREEV